MRTLSDWRRSEAAVTRRTRNAFVGSSRHEGSNPSVSATNGRNSQCVFRPFVLLKRKDNRQHPLKCLGCIYGMWLFCRHDKDLAGMNQMLDSVYCEKSGAFQNSYHRITGGVAAMRQVGLIQNSSVD